MKKKQKKHRRGSILTQKPTYSPGVIERIGLLSIGRQEALIRQLDTATWLWFQDQEPLSIHLIVMAAYNILHELGSSPLPLDEIDLAKSYTVYDFLRHSASKNLNEGIDFVPSENGSLLYATIKAFAKACGGFTARMRVLEAYAPVHLISYPEIGEISEARDFLAKFLPKEITLEEAIALGRIEFYNRFYPRFASDAASIPSPCG